jgi:hypothetical protein
MRCCGQQGKERCWLPQAAVDAYGAEDEELWLRYVQHSMRHRKGVGALYWRATKALRNPQAFEQKYHALQQQGCAVGATEL